ncbi:hypothetical protein B0H14DRAFT_2591332 [Mycena olivaceomarginata]|nr:hypothetical protein B0H14DRAFT_2591332 [Mycena olivaceomarginata]
MQNYQGRLARKASFSRSRFSLSGPSNLHQIIQPAQLQGQYVSDFGLDGSAQQLEVKFSRFNAVFILDDGHDDVRLDVKWTPWYGTVRDSCLRTSTSHPALQRNKSAQNLHHLSTSAAANSSRVRLMLSKLEKRAAALIVALPPSSSSTSSKAAPSVDSALFRPYLPLAAQYERASNSASLAFACAPGSPPPSPDSSECPCSSNASHAPPSPTASSFSATSSLSHSSRYSSADRPYSFIPASTVADPALNGEGVYEDADPFAKGAVRVVHRSCEALPSTYSYHSTNNYSGYAASLRVRRTGRGRRVPIAPLIRARARELDVELRELSRETEGDEVEFAVVKDD